jgi:hypothetical protein
MLVVLVIALFLALGLQLSRWRRHRAEYASAWEDYRRALLYLDYGKITTFTALERSERILDAELLFKSERDPSLALMCTAPDCVT